GESATNVAGWSSSWEREIRLGARDTRTRVSGSWEREHLARTGAPAPGTTYLLLRVAKSTVRAVCWTRQQGEQDARAPRAADTKRGAQDARATRTTGASRALLMDTSVGFFHRYREEHAPESQIVGHLEATSH